MNYPQARRKARTVFGKEGDARLVKTGAPLFKAVYTVGVVRNGQFIPLGAGKSWDEAFNNVKEVNHGEENEEVDSASGNTRASGVGGNTVVDTGTNPTSSVHRVKLT